MKTTYYNGAFIVIGGSAMTPTPFAAVRLSNTWDAATNVLSHYENGTLYATRPNVTGTTTNDFFYNSGIGINGSAYFDDVDIRKFVTNEPRVSIDQSNDIAFVASVAPVFSFTVSSHTGSCNGVAISNGSATASTLNLSRVTAGANSVAAQDLSATSNANLGFTVGTKYAGPLISGVNTIANVTGTNPSPSAFPSQGTAGFGYSTADLSRFATPSAQWAAFTTSSAVVFFSSGATTKTTCIAVQAGVSPATPAGTYSTTVYYSAAPTF